MKKVFFSVLIGILLWGSGFIWFLNTLPLKNSAVPVIPTDATVVLTGGANRVETGLKFQQQGLSKKLFVSGVWKNTKPQDFFNEYNIKDENLQKAINFGHYADNTIENAQETLQWMKVNQFKSLRLVTSNYHMRRSLLEFYQRLEDIEIYPYIIVPASFQQKGWWRKSELSLLVFREYNKFIASLARCGGRWIALKIQSLRLA